MPRLKQRYNDELREQLKEQFGLSSIMQAPRITKITLNMGVGEAKTDAKVLDAAMDELTHHRRASARRCAAPASRSRSSRSARACRSARASRCAATGCGSSSTG